MARLIVLLSGRICTGKSTVAEGLKREHQFVHVLTRGFLRNREQNLEAERGAMQNYGEYLDKKTRGAWLRDDLAKVVESNPQNAIIVVDSIRAKCQIDRVRESYRGISVHVHLDCTDEELNRRYKERGDQNLKEFKSFADTLLNKTEKAVPELEREADISIRTDRCNAADVLTRVACYLGLYGRGCPRNVDVLVGGQYGSEGKGQVAAYLSKEYELLVRVGGPNAGHKVFEEDKPYTFHLLPSGTRSSEANLLIGAGAALRMDVLRREIAECRVDYQRLSIDPHAIIITEADCNWEMKRLRETISSTAQGTGRAAIRRIERKSGTILAKDLKELKPFIRSGVEVIERVRARGGKIQLEGTQGTGLSLLHGHYPFVTSRDTTAAACLAEAGIAPTAVRKVIMVCRTYPIRVQSPEGGTSGPMSAEITLEELSQRSKIPLEELKRTERTSTTNRMRRIAEFDWHQFQRSSTLNGPTDIALTFADYFDIRNRDARRFAKLTPETLLFIAELERVSSANVSLICVGFNHRTVLDRRNWS